MNAVTGNLLLILVGGPTVMIAPFLIARELVQRHDRAELDHLNRAEPARKELTNR